MLSKFLPRPTPASVKLSNGSSVRKARLDA